MENFGREMSARLDRGGEKVVSLSTSKRRKSGSLKVAGGKTGPGVQIVESRKDNRGQAAC